MEYLVRNNSKRKEEARICLLDACPINTICGIVTCGANLSGCGINGCALRISF